MKRKHKRHSNIHKKGGECKMDSEKLDALIAEAKNLAELTAKLTEAANALKEPGAPTPDTFTQEELDQVLARVEDLKTALTALKTP